VLTVRPEFNAVTYETRNAGDSVMCVLYKMNNKVDALQTDQKFDVISILQHSIQT